MFYWLKNEEDKAKLWSALRALNEIYPRMVAQDMLIALERNAGFLEEPEFRAAFDAEASDEQERSLAWRLHVLCWCARNALRVAGDFVECGVFRAFSSAVAMRYLDFSRESRTWYLYDTFSGVPEDQLNPGHSNPIPAAAATDLHEVAKQRVAAFPNARVIRGRVPEVFDEVVPGNIAFLHLDMNSAAAEVGALDRLLGKLVAGAYVLLDDYGWYAYRAQKHAEDAYFDALGYKVLELPTGQGLVII
jgi:hypothetical protein